MTFQKIEDGMSQKRQHKEKGKFTRGEDMMITRMKIQRIYEVHKMYQSAYPTDETFCIFLSFGSWICQDSCLQKGPNK